MTRSLNKALSIKSQNKHIACYHGELTCNEIKKKHKKELSKRNRLETKRNTLNEISCHDRWCDK